MNRIEKILKVMDTMHSKKLSDSEMLEMFMTCADNRTLDEVLEMLLEE